MNLENVLNIISNIVDYNNKNLTKKQYQDLLECKEYLQENSIAKKDTIYIINVTDFDDGTLLMNLAYDNENDYIMAKQLIDQARCEWWEKEIDYCMTDYIEEHLKAKGLLGISIWKCKIEV